MCWVTTIFRHHESDPSTSAGLSARVRCAVERIDRAATEIELALADIRGATRGDDQ